MASQEPPAPAAKRLCSRPGRKEKEVRLVVPETRVIQTDVANFRNLVQELTGASSAAAAAAADMPPAFIAPTGTAGPGALSQGRPGALMPTPAPISRNQTVALTSRVPKACSNSKPAAGDQGDGILSLPSSLFPVPGNAAAAPLLAASAVGSSLLPTPPGLGVAGPPQADPSMASFLAAELPQLSLRTQHQARLQQRLQALQGLPALTGEQQEHPPPHWEMQTTGKHEEQPQERRQQQEEDHQQHFQQQQQQYLQQQYQQHHQQHQEPQQQQQQQQQHQHQLQQQNQQQHQHHQQQLQTQSQPQKEQPQQVEQHQQEQQHQQQQLQQQHPQQQGSLALSLHEQHLQSAGQGVLPPTFGSSPSATSGSVLAASPAFDGKKTDEVEAGRPKAASPVKPVFRRQGELHGHKQLQVRMQNGQQESSALGGQLDLLLGLEGPRMEQLLQAQALLQQAQGAVVPLPAGYASGLAEAARPALGVSTVDGVPDGGQAEATVGARPADGVGASGRGSASTKSGVSIGFQCVTDQSTGAVMDEQQQRQQEGMQQKKYAGEDGEEVSDAMFPPGVKDGLQLTLHDVSAAGPEAVPAGMNDRSAVPDVVPGIDVSKLASEGTATPVGTHEHAHSTTTGDDDSENAASRFISAEKQEVQEQQGPTRSRPAQGPGASKNRLRSLAPPPISPAQQPQGFLLVPPRGPWRPPRGNIAPDATCPGGGASILGMGPHCRGRNNSISPLPRSPFPVSPFPLSPFPQSPFPHSFARMLHSPRLGSPFLSPRAGSPLASPSFAAGSVIGVPGPNGGGNTGGSWSSQPESPGSLAMLELATMMAQPPRPGAGLLGSGASRENRNNPNLTGVGSQAGGASRLSLDQ